jgi:hypothetical protein
MIVWLTRPWERWDGGTGGGGETCSSNLDGLQGRIWVGPGTSRSDLAPLQVDAFGGVKAAR